MIQKIQDCLQKARYLLSLKQNILFFFVFIAIYTVLQLTLNHLEETLPALAHKLLFIIPFITLHLISAILISLSLILVINRIKELRQMSIHTGTSTIALTLSLLAGGCPGCLAGFFPTILNLFGVTASLSILPFYGFELQIISILLSSISIYYLSKDITCTITHQPIASPKK